MDSKELLKKGFSEIENPRNWSELPKGSRIYVFCISKLLKKLEGETDIIYIGETKDIRRRMKEYFEPNGWIKDGGTVIE